MTRNSGFGHRASCWLVAAALFSLGATAIAQTEPTLTQVYEAVQAGRLEQAQTMMQQVLISHPNSAKAHFVQAEIAARQGQLGRAREALASAEKLAPGLPFAKEESVQHLRAQLTDKGNRSGNSNSGALSSSSSAISPANNPSTPAPALPFSWTMVMGLGALAIGLGLILFRRKSAARAETGPGNFSPLNSNPGQARYSGNPAMNGGLGGAQNFGSRPTGSPLGQSAGTAGIGAGAGIGAATGMGAGTGMGGKVVGGIATGLAVGAGVMAAQAIGRSMMGGNEHPKHDGENLANNDLIPFDLNEDSGGQNFGVQDANSWDDGGSLASQDDGDNWDT